MIKQKLSKEEKDKLREFISENLEIRISGYSTGENSIQVSVDLFIKNEIGESCSFSSNSTEITHSISNEDSWRY